jgi:hypothetical protein
MYQLAKTVGELMLIWAMANQGLIFLAKVILFVALR